MPTAVRPLRPRLVIRIACDGSLDFAATSDVEVIIVRAGWPRFRVFPSLRVGIEQVRRLLSGRDATPEPAVPKRASALRAAR
jgi:hypothetical protein